MFYDRPSVGKLLEYFTCNSDVAEDLLAIWDYGYQDGLQGFYQDGEYVTDPDWIEGISELICQCENDVGEEMAEEVMDLYVAGHTVGFKEFEDFHYQSYHNEYDEDERDPRFTG